MPLHISQRDQTELLAKGAELTFSAGFLPDAKAVGFRRAPDQPVFGVAIFEAFENARAMLHLGLEPGHRMTRDVFQALNLFAFHPKALGLRELRVRIAANDAHTQATALKYGFEFEYRDRGGLIGQIDGIILSLQHSSARLAD